ncbi:MetQ/NlpA family ABC transporter substrate-binding protein [Streptococcus pantholopis]|uniref:Lipoprotein n=1 Tax=Streptococcus pantholopis TaxID=1811193 RepID=A0A172Q5I8_9STRE|nr:MetQ/NlpA family ABC transporter substrate-binding protein [Streptococcus pantholopis]AND78720.1 O-sialoglycoprotein endopeptidase [Streptococcus pantholopis]
MTFKKILGLAGLVLASALFLTACGSTNDDSNTLTVGVMTMSDSDKARWDKIEDLLEEEDIDLEFKEFTDYSQPNKALANGEVDINAFQHYNFLDNWNKENKEDLAVVAETYISPIHLFSGTENGKAKYTDLKELPDGAQIAVPNDATNESRALYVLQDAGLIKLDVSGQELATIANISENKKNLDIKELDASQTARALSSADAAIVNNSYAVEAGVDYDTSLYTEEVNDASEQWINVIAAQSDWKDSDKAEIINKLIKVYHTDEVKKVIDETSEGIDQPVW